MGKIYFQDSGPVGILTYRGKVLEKLNTRVFFHYEPTLITIEEGGLHVGSAATGIFSRIT